MGQQFIIDSNAVIDFLSGILPVEGKSFMSQVINSTPKISVITKIEVLGFNTNPESYQLLQSFISDSVLYTLTDEVIDKTIEIRKSNKIKTPDAIIAATALLNNFILISRNVKDFKNIADLKVIDPYTL